MVHVVVQETAHDSSTSARNACYVSHGSIHISGLRREITSPSVARRSLPRSRMTGSSALSMTLTLVNTTATVSAGQVIRHKNNWDLRRHRHYRRPGIVDPYRPNYSLPLDLLCLLLYEVVAVLTLTQSQGKIRAEKECT